uniref:Uncharacterized protein n=1 Tax=Physcomitrium patens TaxID=3218 RepID=A0A2K1KDT7_PHYPA|nr:hypothetical protein PHYPA_008314 [Physcomitrium patens]
MKIGGPAASLVLVRRKVHKYHMGCSTLGIGRKIRLRPQGLFRQPIYILCEPW